jgi:hypothetical protein
MKTGLCVRFVMNLTEIIDGPRVHGTISRPVQTVNNGAFRRWNLPPKNIILAENAHLSHAEVNYSGNFTCIGKILQRVQHHFGE